LTKPLTIMGNTCAQENCFSMTKDQQEATFDLDSEHAHAYPSRHHVQSKTADFLPALIHSSRLSQEQCKKLSQSNKEMLSHETSPTESEALDHILISKKSRSISFAACDENIDLSTQSTDASSPKALPVAEVQDGHEQCDPVPESEAETLGNHMKPESVSEPAPEEIPELVVEPIHESEAKPLIEEPVLEEPVPEEPVLEPLSEPAVNSMTEKAPSLELVFEVDGAKRRVLVHRRPLGAEFAKGLMGGPTKIRKVNPNSHAAELGMEKGWIIKAIGSEDVSNQKLQNTQNILKNALMSLPLCA
jgi:hypothetical protein